MSTALKRKRASSSYSFASDMALRVNPPLPTLSADSLLAVYTHPSLVLDNVPNNSRLQEIGIVALHYAVSRLLWMREDEPSKGIEEERATILSDVNLADWARQYKLRERLRYGPDVASSIDKTAELANVFRAYAGAVDKEHGPIALITWIETLCQVPYSSDAPQPTTPNPSATPVTKSGVFSALLNECAQQHHHKLEFKSESSGASHNLVWTMRIIVDGIERGVGTGSSKSAAKEDAARKTCFLLGWKH